MKIRDDWCGGNAAELARRIKKDPTYVNRLFYPSDKKGAKGVGLEIMNACTEAFGLPAGYWDGIGEPATQPQQWPFPKVPLERFLALADDDRGYVQRRLLQAIEECESSTPQQDVREQLRNISLPRVKPAKTGKKAA